MQQRVTFESRQGHNLSGIIHIPDNGRVLAYALFAHCFTCTKNINAAANIVDVLSSQGIATLRFDFTGLGASKGKFEESSFSTNIEDLVDAANFLSQEYQAPQLLVGHSLGGTAILAASKYIDSAKAVASIASPAEPEHILHLLSEDLQCIADEGSANVNLAGRTFTFKQEFVDDVKKHTVDFKHLKKALMVMHSPIDDTVAIAEAAKIFGEAMHPKSFVTLENADHLLSKEVDSTYVGTVLATWAKRYIELTEHDPDEDLGVTVTAKTDQGFVCNVNANGHLFVADEPKSVEGGTNLGPTPYDLLASSLGTCTAMTLNMYARFKKLPVQSVTVEVDHNRIHATDCVDCEQSEGHVDVFTRRILISGTLDQTQKERMLEIADRCPVHKTLENEIKIKTQLK